MALHLKQRSIVDATPQFVRLPTSRSSKRAMRYSLHESHMRTRPLYARRYAAVDRSRKISSLQLRGCFFLCVLLYFGAIYFADDIASFGKIVSSEQSNQNFFVHTLRPRGRGAMRVGRVDRGESESTSAPHLTTTALENAEQKPRYKSLTGSDDKSGMDKAKAASAYSKAPVMKPLQQPEAGLEAIQQEVQQVTSDALTDSMHKDDQDQDVRTNEEPAHVVKSEIAERSNTFSPNHSEPGYKYYEALNQKPVVFAVSSKNHVAASDQPHSTSAASHPDRWVNTNTVNDVTPLNVQQEQQDSRYTLDNGPKHQARKADRLQDSTSTTSNKMNNNSNAENTFGKESDKFGHALNTNAEDTFGEGSDKFGHALNRLSGRQLRTELSS